MTKKFPNGDGRPASDHEAFIDPDGDTTLPDPMDAKFLFTEVLHVAGTDSTASQNILNLDAKEVPENRGVRKTNRAHTGVCLTCGKFFEDGLPFCRDDGQRVIPILTPQCLVEGRESGRVLDGRYLIGKRLSQSHHAIVVEAKQVHLDRQVVIKFIDPACAPTGPAAQSLHHEAFQIAGLDHPRIVRVLDFGIDHGQLPYLVMERLYGRSLADILDTQGPLSDEVVLALGIQICKALSYLHGRGITHRAMHPTNIWCVRTDDGHLNIKLLDFGFCQSLNTAADSNTQAPSTELMGVPTYMSPEQQAGGSVDERTDIYSLGVLLWEALTGHVMVQTEDAGLNLTAVKPQSSTRPVGLRTSLSTPLETVLKVALESHPERRWRSAQTMAQALSILHRSRRTPSSDVNEG